MSSSIFFRFKSQKEPVQITFDGTSLSVFEVKREIIALSKLGDGTDFDLDIYSADGKEIYDDDTTQIPRSTTVIARRHPARSGAGRAARYVTGKMPVNAKNAHRIEASAAAAPGKNTPTMHGAINSGKEMTEEEKLQALLSANDQSWKADQASMSHKPVVRSTYNKSTPVPDKPLPPGYICHRCGEKGHWIQACPTNNDPNFDNRKKIKRTTGIPRSFLKVVEKPAEGEDPAATDPANWPKGVMYTANGEMVTFEPDNATWERIQEKQQAANEKAKEAASDEQGIRDRGLECSIHNGIFVEPVTTPCCGTTYCYNCIESALLDSDLKCPNCDTQPVLLDKLEPDAEMVAKIQAYQEEKKVEREKKAQVQQDAVQSPAAVVESPKEKEEEAKETVVEVSALKMDGSEDGSATPNPKKRPAEEELPNERKPSNPATESSKSESTEQNSTSNTTTSTTTSQTPAQAPIAPAADLAEFQKQMDAMAASVNGPNGNNAPGMMNPAMMAGFNPAMMGMPPPPGMGFPMGMNMPMMGMGMNMPMNMNMNMGMNGMNGMNMNMNMPMGMGTGMGMNAMPNFGDMNGMGNMGMNGMGMNGGWNGNTNGNGNWHGGAGRGGMQGGGGNDSPYMRQPVNPNRYRGRQNRPRSADYRQI